MTDTKAAPALSWDGHCLYKLRAYKPCAVLVIDWDDSCKYRVRLRDGRVSDAMSLPQAKAWAWTAAGGR
jgi:hypothetical protein